MKQAALLCAVFSAAGLCYFESALRFASPISSERVHV
jgi:hypothetical protein